MLNDEQNNLITTVAKKNGIDSFSITVEEGSKKGDNYLGEITLITIKEKGSSKTLSLILKSALKNEQVREQMPVGAVYSREIFLYDTILPAFVKLQEKYPLPHKFKAFAKFYGYSLKDRYEWLLMEDLRTHGFRMHNRKVTMDGQHVTLVFTELAKFHSLSFVMKHVDLEQYKKLTKDLVDQFKDNKQMFDAFTEGIKKKFVYAFKIMDGNEEATEALKRCKEVLENTFKELQEDKNDLVVVHADSWCNNMMFKYEDSNNPDKPTQQCFLDWQMSKVGNPVLDLIYFMFLSGSKEVLDQHKKYLQLYHQVLSENLLAIGCDVNSVFSYEFFEKNWKEYCKIGLFIALTMLETLLRDEKDAKTLTDMADDGKYIFDMFLNSDGAENNQYCQRIKDIILMLVENKYI